MGRHMTSQQETHAQKLVLEFKRRMLSKYSRGVKEHGGNIWDMTEKELLENALDEAIDQVVYLLTLREKL